MKYKKLLTSKEKKNYIKQLFGTDNEPIIFKMLIDDAIEYGRRNMFKDIENIINKIVKERK
jgi:hypothetical protein